LKKLLLIKNDTIEQKLRENFQKVANRLPSCWDSV